MPPSILGRSAAVLIAIAAMATSPGAPAATSDTPADYTHSLPLGVSGRAGVVAYRLPQTVYLQAHSSALNDIRLFDRLGNPLPFALMQEAAVSRTSRQDVPVKVFPLMGARASDPSQAAGLDIRTGADGRLLSVTSREAPDRTGPAELTALVLDLSRGADGAAPLVGALRFAPPAGASNYDAQVWLDVSDDLKQWQTIGTADLTWLVNRDTQTLSNDRIGFEPTRFRYARLSWKRGAPLLFGAVTAEVIEHTALAPRTETLLLTPGPGQQGQDLVYQSAIAIPTEQIGLQFNEQNVVLPSQLGRYRELPSRQLGQPSTWLFESLAGSTFYQITQGGQQRRSGDLPIATTHNAQWVLRPQGGQAVAPRLRLTWSPASLVFLANGNAPYQLAFGRDQAEAAALALSQVAPGFGQQELRDLEQAQAGPLVTRKTAPAEASLAQAAGASAHARIAALWGVLLLGVAVLGFFAWRLFKQMDGPAAPP
ncbi:MAG: DUF3999 family protein [Pseudomonadota bacterium]